MTRPVYILALAAFAIGTQSYVFAGLLAELAKDLDASISAAGQLMTAFAITSAIASPLVVSSLVRFPRRGVLIASLSGVAALNFASAFLPTYESYLAMRIVIAITGSAVMPMAGAIAAELTPPEKQGQALGLVLSGLTIAFIAGVPLGTAIGGYFGWRSTFVFAGVAAALVVPAIYFGVPRSTVLLDTSNVQADWSVLKQPIVLTCLALIGLAFVAAYPVKAFIGPLITELTGFEGSSIAVMQSAIGFGSLLGLVVGSRLADARSFVSNMREMFLVLTIALAAWSFLFTFLEVRSMTAIGLTFVTTLISSAALIAPSPAIEKALVRAAPDQSSLTLALNTSTIYLGQGIGAALGGIVIASSGYWAIGFAGAVVASLALFLAWLGPEENR
ncbi:MFS transporter [Parasphingorhabdus litoris]|uniref:MFS transporter n=1 Tax=Parasphingorhabdus litoris TaxID=394733 RepID=A0ABN1A1E6_9SPHN|nr:MFS transporter [Parasphingorhabdus litoris]